MRFGSAALVSITLILSSCNSAQTVTTGPAILSPSGGKAVDAAVRAFAETVAQDLNKEGPSAWRKHFADSPSFFMASEGRMVFENSAAATTGIQQLAQIIKLIELQWGNDLRVDPLTDDLAVLAASYRETRVSADVQRVQETGFFTGTVERRNGRWQFRNAHWSVAAPPEQIR